MEQDVVNRGDFPGQGTGTLEIRLARMAMILYRTIMKK